MPTNYRYNFKSNGAGSARLGKTSYSRYVRRHSRYSRRRSSSGGSGFFEDYIESYSLNVEGYLLKPLQYESFKHIFSKYYEKFKSLYSFIVVTDKNKIPQKIFVNDIIFIEIYSRQCVFHTINSYIKLKSHHPSH